MKKYFCLLLIFCACTNPKIKIVEREKLINKEIDKFNWQIDSIRKINTKRIEDYVVSKHKDSPVNVNSFEHWGWDSSGYQKRSDQEDSLRHKIVKLQDAKDSLEMELKKY